MSANDAVPALNKFLTSCARSAVVRLWDPSFDRSSSGLFTGFFVSPVGHLLTAFHPLRHRLWVIEFTAAEFDLEIEFDATEHASEPREDTIRLPAVCKQGWGDHGADWAVLKVNYAPRSYLPVAAAGHLQPPHDSLCSQVRAYGFTKTQPVFPSLGAYEGQYSRALPEISRFRMSFVNRGVGQSGGPVIDLQSRTVIGVVSGLQAPDGELLTADAAVIDRATFPHF
jgi:hypothetical protein